MSKFRFFSLDNTVLVPSTVHFRSQTTNDEIRINFTQQLQNQEEVLLFACLTDTRYSDFRLIPAVSLPGILRTVQSNLTESFNLVDTINQTELRIGQLHLL